MQVFWADIFVWMRFKRLSANQLVNDIRVFEQTISSWNKIISTFILKEEFGSYSEYLLLKDDFMAITSVERLNGRMGTLLIFRNRRTLS